jgi:putative protein kinase ArgK-like GTPase of G3E family
VKVYGCSIKTIRFKSGIHQMGHAAITGAGYDIILVETVGVGQSETVVADIVDMVNEE